MYLFSSIVLKLHLRLSLLWSTLERAPFRVGLNLTRVELKELNVPMRPWNNNKLVEFFIDFKGVLI